MSKNNNDNNQNNISPYLNWFGKDNQELKRGGTAPIMYSRRSRPTAGLDIFNLENKDEDNIYKEDSKDIPVITTSYGTSTNLNNSRRGTNPSDSHSITRVFNPSGIGIYRLTKKKSGADHVPLPATTNIDTMLSNTVISSASNFKAERKNDQTPTQQENQQKDLRETPISFFNSGFPSSATNNRPGSSHYKGGSAFRRCRIMNESPQNLEEYQTPNTGNLELESLNNINNQSSARDPSPTLQLDPKPKQNEFVLTHEPKIGISMRSQNKQAEKFGNEGNEPSFKFFGDSRAAQRINLKTIGSKRGNFAQEELEYEKPNDTKNSKNSTTDVKQKAKHVLEGRRYAEDIESLNITEPDNDFKVEGLGNRLAKEQAKIEERLNQNAKENSLENFYFGSPQKFNLDQEGEVDQEILSLQRTPVERPPARKNGQAMNLDDRASLHQSDKKHLMKSPMQLQDQMLNKERPPSRHKIPNKALGLDLPDNASKQEVRSAQNYENQLSTQNKEVVMLGRKGHHIKNRDPGFEFENDDFEHLNFDKVLDLSDFLEGDDNEQNCSHIRPKTTAINQRESLQTGQSFRSKEGFKHIGLQSAKGRPVATQSLGHNALLSSKLEAFNKMRNNKTKTETRLENAYDPSKDEKLKSQTKRNEDIETFEVLDIESDSDESSGSISPRQSQQQSNRTSKGVLGVKPWKPEKMTKNNFLSEDHSIFKDKKITDSFHSP